MKEQPEALTFPELLETVPNDAYLTIPNETGREVRIIPVGRYCHNAAAELRRLSAVEAQRDALLKALAVVLLEAEHTLLEPTRRKARAAIKAVEENT